MRLAFALGNTRLKYGLFRECKLLESGALAWADLAAGGFLRLREVVEEAACAEVLVASVRDDRLAELASVLPQGASRLRVARRDFPVPIENRCSTPELVGTDRLLNALAARERWPHSSVAVFDFGTALSVSVVSPDGAFVGGLIGVGLPAALSALRQSTPRLPAVDVAPSRGYVQDNTKTALGAGVFWQFTGGAQRILDGVRGELPQPLHVVATGGDAERFVPSLRGIDAVDPDLTLRGLVIAAGVC
jgi:type III pantothenate kinase